MVLSNPSVYLSEVCRDINRATGTEVAPSIICRLLKAYGITRKRIRQVALQRCAILRGAFMAKCLLLTADMFVWVDETGSDARNHIRRYGYALRGMRAVCSRLLSRGKRINAIAGMATTGVVALGLTDSTVNAGFFLILQEAALSPTCCPSMDPIQGQ